MRPTSALGLVNQPVMCTHSTCHVDLFCSHLRINGGHWQTAITKYQENAVAVWSMFQAKEIIFINLFWTYKISQTKHRQRIRSRWFISLVCVLYERLGPVLAFDILFHFSLLSNSKSHHRDILQFFLRIRNNLGMILWDRRQLSHTNQLELNSLNKLSFIFDVCMRMVAVEKAEADWQHNKYISYIWMFGMLICGHDFHK